MIRVEQEILAFAADKDTKRVLCWSCVGSRRRRRRRRDKISDDDVVRVEDEEDDQEYIGWGLECLDSMQHQPSKRMGIRRSLASPITLCPYFGLVSYIDFQPSLWLGIDFVQIRPYFGPLTFSPSPMKMTLNFHLYNISFINEVHVDKKKKYFKQKHS